MSDFAQLMQGAVRLDGETLWRLQSMSFELIQGAGVYRLDPILDLLTDILENDLPRRQISARRRHIVEGLFQWHCGPWVLA